VQILLHHMKGVTTSESESNHMIVRDAWLTLRSGVDPMILARGTPGFSGADLQNMVKCAPSVVCVDGVYQHVD
jgi:ATP-dependent Zn protease